MYKIKSAKQKAFHIVLAAVMLLIVAITVYPVWFSLINSFENASEIEKNGFALIWTRRFTLESWEAVLGNSKIITAFLVTLARTVIVTVLQTLITSMFSYGFSKSCLAGKGFYKAIGFLSMYLNGGVIAYFILFNALHIYDSFWVYILPCLFGGFYNVIIYTANFKAIPEALFESAKLDGAGEPTVFFRIVFPLSKPVIGALALFTAVSMWNDYTGTLYFTKTSELQTISYYTLSLIKSSQLASNLASTMSTSSTSSLVTTLSEAAAGYKTIELASMVLSALPLIIIYPFAQKTFEKGMMVGSVKG